MKKTELIFATILIPVDYVMLMLAALAAYYLRFTGFVTEIRPVIFDLQINEFILISLIVSLGYLFVFAISGLYKIKGPKKIIQEISKVLLACSTGIMAVIVYMFFVREMFSSRFIILFAWIFSILFISFGRIIIRIIQSYFNKKGYGIRKVVIIGRDKITNDIISFINKKKSSGYKIMLQARDFSPQIRKQILKLNKKNPIDEILVTDSNLSRKENLTIIDFAKNNFMGFKYVPGAFEAATTNIEVNTVAGVPIIELKRTPLDGWGRIAKRALDIFGSLIGIILLSPIMLIVALAIKLDSKGPVFFTYKRVGLHGQPFTFRKFRSMIADAHKYRFDPEFLAQQKNLREGTPMMKFEKDPRITRIGNFLRKTSLDELPQFFSVLSGTMSIVGPRPHEIEEVAKYEKHQKQVLDIKPGVTGLPQISGRSDLHFNDEVKLDTFYIRNWSLRLDLYIIFKTIFVVLSGKNR